MRCGTVKGDVKILDHYRREACTIFVNSAVAETGAIRSESESNLSQLEQSNLVKAIRGGLIPQEQFGEPAHYFLADIRTTFVT